MNIDDLLKKYSQDFLGFDEGKPVTVHSRDYCGDTPLHIASISGQLEDVALLIAAGACVNAPGEDGHTSLHYATSFGHIAIIQKLLIAGADPTIRDDLFGRSASEIALASDNPAIIHLFAAISGNGVPFPHSNVQ